VTICWPHPTFADATGSIANCVNRLNEYLAVGVDHILPHGTTPDMQDEIVARVQQAG
jgi:hypothetical protein